MPTYTPEQLAELGWLSPEKAAILRREIDEVERRLDAATEAAASRTAEIAELKRRMAVLEAMFERLAKGERNH